MTADYREARYSAQDGLRLYYRDYGDPLSTGPALLCLPGLTRNSIDFHDLASRYCDRFRVLCPDLRGRGRSERDPLGTSYVPEQYLLDIVHLLAVTGCHRVIIVGTSLGGLLGLGFAVVQASALAGVVLNDIGPELDPRGLARIAGYAGDDPGPMSEEEAVARNRMLFSAALPNLTDEEWLAETRRGYRRYDDGSYGLDYDPAIGQVGGGEVPDLWPYFRALRRIPTLAIRGALSDILSERTFERMAEEKPDLVRATVPNRGHVPMLDEPECLAALDAFLESFSHERH